MIRFILLQNRAGKTRLSKWYVSYQEEEKEKLRNEVHRIITSRDSKFTNFAEVRRPRFARRCCSSALPVLCRCCYCVALLVLTGACLRVRMLQFMTYKIIYRRYAGLFFAVCCDITDNELAYFEAIHLFVEVLDKYFGNVCELDLVFNFHKVRAVWLRLWLRVWLRAWSGGCGAAGVHGLTRARCRARRRT